MITKITTTVERIPEKTNKWRIHTLIERSNPAHTCTLDTVYKVRKSEEHPDTIHHDYMAGHSESVAKAVQYPFHLSDFIESITPDPVPPYRLLEHGEILEAGDECHCGSGNETLFAYNKPEQAWFSVGKKHLGEPYNAGRSVIRRKVLPY